MPERLVCDSDILIEYLRGAAKAISFLEDRDEIFLLSTITIAELFTGARNASEEATLEKFLFGFELIPVSESIARQGGLLRQKFHPSHGTGLADALIAATVIEANASLVTFNTKHFPMLDNIIVPYTR